MYRILIILGTFIVLILGYFIFIPLYFFKYYYSSDKSIVLTRVNKINVRGLSKETYLTPGYYTKHRVPETYVMPQPSRHGERAQYITLHSLGIFIIGDTAITKNLSERFNYMAQSITDYSKVRYIDSLENSFKNKEHIAIMSYDN